MWQHATQIVFPQHSSDIHIVIGQQFVQVETCHHPNNTMPTEPCQGISTTGATGLNVERLRPSKHLKDQYRFALLNFPQPSSGD
jgi:hypothetical protein